MMNPMKLTPCVDWSALLLDFRAVEVFKVRSTKRTGVVVMVRLMLLEEMLS